MAALACLVSLNARAADKVTVEAGGRAAETEDTGGGMPSSNPRVRPILAAHPGQLVVICVAGCDGKPRAVQILPGPVTARVGAFVPSAAKMGKEVYGPPHPAKLAGQGAADNDVICIAGCMGRPGQVLQRVSDLPPRKRPAAKAAKDEAAKGKGNEPLGILP
jgi:hypothetical protein